MLARMMAQPSQHPGQGQRIPNRTSGLVEFSGFNFPDHDRNVESERAQPMAGGQAITDVIAEKKLQRGSARFMDFLGLALHDHSRFDLGSAGGNEFAVDFDHARQARIERAAFFEIAKGGNVETKPPRGGENRTAGADGGGDGVDC